MWKIVSSPLQRERWGRRRSEREERLEELNIASQDSSVDIDGTHDDVRSEEKDNDNKQDNRHINKSMHVIKSMRLDEFSVPTKYYGDLNVTLDASASLWYHSDYHDDLKILRLCKDFWFDNDNTIIIKSPLRSICHRVGVLYPSSLLLNELSGWTKIGLENIIRGITTLTEHARRKTVTERDIYNALWSAGYHSPTIIYGGPLRIMKGLDIYMFNLNVTGASKLDDDAKSVVIDMCQSLIHRALDRLPGNLNAQLSRKRKLRRLRPDNDTIRLIHIKQSFFETFIRKTFPDNLSRKLISKIKESLRLYKKSGRIGIDEDNMESIQKLFRNQYQCAVDDIIVLHISAIVKFIFAAIIECAVATFPMGSSITPRRLFLSIMRNPELKQLLLDGPNIRGIIVNGGVERLIDPEMHFLQYRQSTLDPPTINLPQNWTFDAIFLEALESLPLEKGVLIDPRDGYHYRLREHSSSSDKSFERVIERDNGSALSQAERIKLARDGLSPVHRHVMELEDWKARCEVVKNEQNTLECESAFRNHIKWFIRLVREIVQDFRTDLRMTKTCIFSLVIYIEDFITRKAREIASTQSSAIRKQDIDIDFWCEYPTESSHVIDLTDTTEIDLDQEEEEEEEWDLGSKKRRPRVSPLIRISKKIRQENTNSGLWRQNDNYW